MFYIEMVFKPWFHLGERVKSIKSSLFTSESKLLYWMPAPVIVIVRNKKIRTVSSDDYFVYDMETCAIL